MIKVTIGGKIKNEAHIKNSGPLYAYDPVGAEQGAMDKAQKMLPPIGAGMEECACGCAGNQDLHVPEYGESPTGNPDLNGDGVYSPEELYYHFDLDGDGIVLPDEYKAHVDWHAEHPEILGQMAGDEIYELDERACWKTHKKVGTKMKGGKRVNDCVKKENMQTNEQCMCEKCMQEAKYKGRTVPLDKKMKGDVKKSKVYTKNASGKVIKVNFGDKNMRIKKSSPERKRAFNSRHNCDNPGPKTKPRYWSCKEWNKSSD